MASIQRFETEISGNILQIWGNGGKLANFFGALTPRPDDQLIIKTASVNGHSRKRYPGATPTSVDGHSRTTKDRPTKGGKTLPGFRFWCERPSGQGANRRSNAVQFNYSGNWGDLVDFAMTVGAGAPFVLRNSSGRSILVND